MVKQYKKLRELILYICDKSKNHPKKLGMVKLNKILFFSDFTAYLRHGSSITGAKYFKNQFGPTARKIDDIFLKMVSDNELKIETMNVYGKPKYVPIALKEPSNNIFREEELAIIDEIIKKLKDENATEVRDLSHEFIGYKLAEPYEDIPYHTVFCQEQKPQKLSNKVTKRADEILAKYKIG